LNRCNARGTIAHLARGVVYLVNYPDGTRTAHTSIGGVDITKTGDELLDGWLVDRIRLAKAGCVTDHGLAISFEVWVERKAPTDPGV
jgi:hypothetical protein